MRTWAIFRPEIAVPLGGTFLRWYLREGVRIPKRGWEYQRTINAILSIGFLLRTLIAPWKNIVEKPKTRGLSALCGVIVMSLISRGIGAVIRTGALIVAIAMQCAVIAFTVCYLIVWVAYPLVLLTVFTRLVLASL